MPKTFPIIQVYLRWRRRHRHPVSFVLHAVGIPACFIAAPVLLLYRQPAAAAVCFVGGYALQLLGHFIEGNRSGEEILFRRIFGKFRQR
ncbi:MAG: Mpo1-like protein [Planctomycetota bacterium]|nr:Mpo1-like protein [Planctomycetota bacterium]